jgi:signal transduction histidine kinase
MQNLALRIVAKLSETLNAGRIGEPKWKECLVMMDWEIALDASFLLLDRNLVDDLDRNHDDDVQLVDTTTNKLSTFSGEQFPLDGAFLQTVAREKVWGWHPMERNRFADDALWELLWVTMNLGAYAGPHKVCAIALPGRVDGNGNVETVGVLLLFLPSEREEPPPAEWPECAQLLAHIFSMAAQSALARRHAQDAIEHNQSEFFARVIGGGKDLNLHRIFQPLQGVELRAEIIRDIAGRSVAKHVDLITAYVHDASTNLRGALYASMRNDAEPVSSQFLAGSGTTNVKKVVDTLVKKFTPQAKNTQKTFVIRYHREPAVFPMPEAAFEEVMGNLIHNAVKYSYANTKIKITFHQSGRGTAIDVTSYGIAIKAEDREKIFFYGFRTPEAVQMEYAGVGMGLPAAREIAGSHGAKLVLSANHPVGGSHPRLGPQYRNTFTLSK